MLSCLTRWEAVLSFVLFRLFHITPAFGEGMSFRWAVGGVHNLRTASAIGRGGTIAALDAAPGIFTCIALAPPVFQPQISICKNYLINSLTAVNEASFTAVCLFMLFLLQHSSFLALSKNIFPAASTPVYDWLCGQNRMKCLPATSTVAGRPLFPVGVGVYWGKLLLCSAVMFNGCPDH